MSRGPALLGTLAVVLIAVTVASFLFAGRFQPVADGLLRNGTLADNAIGWTAVGTPQTMRFIDGGVDLSRAEVGVLLLEQTLPRPRGVDYARLSARVKLIDVRAGKLPWEGARVLLVQHDAEARAQWEFPHQLLRAQGDADWRAFDAVFFLPPQTETLRVVFGLNQASGTVMVRDLALVGLNERPGFVLFRAALALAWLALCLVIAVRVLRRPGRGAAGVAVIAVAVVILLGGLLPHTMKSELSSLARDWGERASPAGPAVTDTSRPAPAAPAPSRQSATDAGLMGLVWTLLHKSGHVTLFALLALVARWCWPRVALWQCGVLLLVFAMSAETLQLLTLDRLSSPRDALLNAVGVIIGLLLAVAIGRWRRQAATS